MGIRNIGDAINRVQNLISEDHLHGVDVGFEERVRAVMDYIDGDAQKTLGNEGLQIMGEEIDAAFLERPPTLLEGALETLSQVKEAGFALGMVSNVGLTSGEAYRVWLNRFGVAQIMDCMVFSNESGCAKPRSEIFEKALNGMGVTADNAIHVGDNIYADIEGAQAVGMTTALVNPLREAKSDAVPDFVVPHISEFIRTAIRFAESKGI